MRHEYRECEKAAGEAAVILFRFFYADIFGNQNRQFTQFRP